MFYFASLCCPGHKDKIQLYDEDKRRPCIGTCGHSICMECIEEDPFLRCPKCDRENVFKTGTLNYQAIELLQTCRENFKKLFENWCHGENFGEGACSKCNLASSGLRVCLECDGTLYRRIKARYINLKLESRVDFINLACHVFCADCAMDSHPMHKTVRIEETQIDRKMVKLVTTEIILLLVQDEINRRKVSCKMSHIKLGRIGHTLAVLIEKLENIEENRCGYLGELIKQEMIKKYTTAVETEMEKIFCGVIQHDCECTRLYEKIETYGSIRELDRIYRRTVQSHIEKLQPGCPLEYKENEVYRQKLYSMADEIPPARNRENDNAHPNCPFCVVVDYYGDGALRENYYRDRCMEQFEMFWKGEMPNLEDVCFNCLSYLMQGCRSCTKRKEIQIMKDSPSNANELMLNLRRIGKRMGDFFECYNKECLMKFEANWKYAIKCQMVDRATLFMVRGIKQEIGYKDCQLRKSSLGDTLRQLEASIKEIDLGDDNERTLREKVVRVDALFDTLKNQWREFQHGTVNERKHLKPGTKCKCSPVCQKNVDMLAHLYTRIDKSVELKEAADERDEALSNLPLMAEMNGLNNIGLFKRFGYGST